MKKWIIALICLSVAVLAAVALWGGRVSAEEYEAAIAQEFAKYGVETCVFSTIPMPKQGRVRLIRPFIMCGNVCSSFRKAASTGKTIRQRACTRQEQLTYPAFFTQSGDFPIRLVFVVFK